MFVPVVALVIWKAGGLDLLIDPNSPHPPFHPGIAPALGFTSGACFRGFNVDALIWVAADGTINCSSSRVTDSLHNWAAS
jgi:hypothetical protein